MKEGNMKEETKENIKARYLPIVRSAFETLFTTSLKLIPIFGVELSKNRQLFNSLSMFFDDGDQVKKDIEKMFVNMKETEEIYFRINSVLKKRSEELDKILHDYEQYKSLADVEKEKLKPIFRELEKEGNKGIIIGLISSVFMLGLGFVLSHYIRLWFPDFNF